MATSARRQELIARGVSADVTAGVFSLVMDEESKRILEGKEFNVFEFGQAWHKFLPAVVKRATQLVKASATNKGLSGGFVREIKGAVNKFSRTRAVAGFRVGIFANSPKANFAGPLELGTQSFNADSYYDDQRPSKSKHLAIPVSAEAKAAGSPREFGSPLMVNMFRHPSKSRGADIVGALIPVEAVHEWKREMMGGFRFPPAAYLLATRVAKRPTFYLKAASFAVGSVTEEMTGEFMQEWFQGGSVK